MALLDLTGRRWALRVMWELSEAGNPLTFRDLRDRCAQMSSSVLTRRLDELCEAHLVTHDDTGYMTTPLGLDLVKRLQPLIEWSGKWAEELHQEHTTTNNDHRRAAPAKRYVGADGPDPFVLARREVPAKDAGTECWPTDEGWGPQKRRAPRRRP